METHDALSLVREYSFNFSRSIIVLTHFVPFITLSIPDEYTRRVYHEYNIMFAQTFVSADSSYM